MASKGSRSQSLAGFLAVGGPCKKIKLLINQCNFYLIIIYIKRFFVFDCDYC